MWVFESPSSTHVHTVSCYFLRGVSQRESFTVVRYDPYLGREDGLVAGGTLGSENPVMKSENNKKLQTGKMSSPLPHLFEVEISWLFFFFFASTHIVHTFPDHTRFKTGKKKMKTTEAAAAAGVERGHFVTKEGLFTRHLAHSEEQSYLTST